MNFALDDGSKQVPVRYLQYYLCLSSSENKRQYKMTLIFVIYTHRWRILLESYLAQGPLAKILLNSHLPEKQ